MRSHGWGGRPCPPRALTITLVVLASSCTLLSPPRPASPARIECTDAVDCQLACAQGDERACVQLADSLDAVGTENASALLAASAYARACDAGQRRACTRAAALLDDKNDAPLARHVADRAGQRLSRLCEEGDDVACGEALRLNDTWGIAGVGRRVLERLQNRCDRGSAAACLEMLVARQMDTGTHEQLEQRIINLSREQCVTGAETACLTMKAFAEVRRREDAADEAERKLRLSSSVVREQSETLAKRCESRDSDAAAACIDLATLYILNGMPVTARYTMGRACDVDDPRGDLCWNAFLLQRDFSSSGVDLAELEQWQKLDAACRGKSEAACALATFGTRVDTATAIDTALAIAAGTGEQRPFGVTKITTVKGSGPPSVERDRVLALVSWHATNGDPLARKSSLDLVSLDRGDALAEVLRGMSVNERVLARISAGPLSPFAIPVLAQVELVAFVPRGLVREMRE
jgi:hypothetical protein